MKEKNILTYILFKFTGHKPTIIFQKLNAKKNEKCFTFGNLPFPLGAEDQWSVLCFIWSISLVCPTQMHTAFFCICLSKIFLSRLQNMFVNFLASQDALEVMWVSQSVTHSWLADLTDVTLVSDDTFKEVIRSDGLWRFACGNVFRQITCL